MAISVSEIISILAIVLTVLNFVFGRKDKSNKDVKEESYKWGAIDQRLTNIEETLKEIKIQLTNNDKEVEEKIAKAIKQHEEVYHKGE